MKSLKYLNISEDCGIKQDGIKGLDLDRLEAEDNSKITNVSFMKKLKILNANGLCG